jgi:predicted nucleic acid-binding protein
MATPPRLGEFRPFVDDPHRAFAASTARPDIKTALIFLDTNVLLAPYRSSTETLGAIKRTYERLKSNNQLAVAAEAAREFARNRLNLLAGVHKYVRDAKSVSVNGDFDAPPILRGLPECEEALKYLGQMQRLTKSYRAALDALTATISRWQSADPVIEVYEPLFDEGVVKNLSLTDERLEAIRKDRYNARVPPGFRDKGKEDGGVGDLAIWLTILETAVAVGKDTLFVTEDGKTDWFHKSGDQRLYPRYELAEEFRATTGGRTFGMLTLSELLKGFGASDKVVQEVRDTEVAPFWIAQAETVEHLLLRDIARRITDAGFSPHFDERSFRPDVMFSVGDFVFGIDVVAVLDTPARSVRQLIYRHIMQARNTAHAYPLTEHCVVFAAPLTETVQILDNILGEERHHGGNVSVVVAHVNEGRLRSTLNTAAHPELRTLFSTPSSPAA